jgi:two-component sensor histidine kinase
MAMSIEKLVKWLPEKPQHILVRYGAATLLVTVCFTLMKLVEAQSGINSFFLLYPAVFLAALLFDRGSGIYSAVLSTVLLIAAIQYEGGPIALFEPYWLPLSLFLLVGLGLAVLTELLRTGWERAIAAERANDLLYRELCHRTKNDFSMAASMLNLQARSQTNAEVKSALASAVGRLLTLSKAHERLDPTEQGKSVQMRDYLGSLCQSLKQSREHAPSVALSVDVDDVGLPVERAIPVGLIVNELVTNAYKHAFAGKEQGSVRVSLRRLKSLTLTVQDDGGGCPDALAPRGVGSQLLELLVRQLNGNLDRTVANPGCRVSVDFPETE